MESMEINQMPIEEAIELLKKGGIEVNREDAEQIMRFLNVLACLIIKECFMND